MPTTLPMHCYTCDQDFTYGDYENHRIDCHHCEESYCTNEFGSECPDCGNEFDSDTSSCDCYDCRERARENGELPYDGIYHYNYVPNLVFHGEGDYHLGIELEISANDSAHPIYEWAQDNGVGGLFYVKEDSSVNGFEIVTHPMTPTYFESVDWNGFFEMLNVTYPLGTTRNGSQRRQEREGHGLHVHVSRTAFPTMTGLARWSYLLNRPGREHMTRIARRVSTQWAQFSDTPVRDVMTTHRDGPTYWEWHMPGYVRHDFDFQMVMCGCGCGSQYENRTFIQPARPTTTHRHRTLSQPRRYNAVNLQNDATAEVRIFRSTRSADEFCDSVRTLYASVEYVRTMQPHHMTNRATSAVMSWQGFAEYVRAEYAALYPTVAGMSIAQDEPSTMSEALAADTAITEGEYQFTSDIPRPYVESVLAAEPRECDVPGCVVRHRVSTPPESRRHEDSHGFSIVALNAGPTRWDLYLDDLVGSL